MTEANRGDGKERRDLRGLRCVIVGSFRFIDEINRTIETLEDHGIQVLAPRMGNVVQSLDGYKVLDVDEGRSPGQIQRDYFFQIRRADFVYIVNPGGYIGTESTWEIGWAWGAAKPVYAQEHINSGSTNQSVYHRGLAETMRVLPLADLLGMVKEGTLDLNDYVLNEWGKHDGN